MEEVQGTEWLLIIAMAVHLLLAPATKVEESFNMQATHDILYHGINLSSYDHNEFPGVVPRTFTGPLFLALLSSPARIVQLIFPFTKMWILFAVRFTMGLCVLSSFVYFARDIEKRLGTEVAFFLRLLTVSQFHFIFYASRLLPNTFALPLVLLVFTLWMSARMEAAAAIAIIATLIFRCELLLLFAPLFLPSLISGRIPIIPLFGATSAVGIALRASLCCLLILVPIDSLFWGRWVWPEADVAYFNIYLNKSHNYGVFPWYYYLASCLPRGLLGAVLFIPLGMYMEPRIRTLVWSSLAFILLYSFLPHKEMRFIMYTFPLLNLPAAVVCARLRINAHKSKLRWMLSVVPYILLAGNLVATSVFVTAASRNYPAADALLWLQHSQRIDAHKNRSVYIDEFSAQNGISRYYQLFDAWEYCKAENLTVDELARFDFLIVGTTGKLRETVKSKFTAFRPMVFAPGFAGYKLRALDTFPFYYPELKMKERVAVMKKKD